MKSVICTETEKALREVMQSRYPGAPIFEKWGRGRPTKEKKQRRIEYQKWQRENNPMIKAFINATNPTIKDGEIKYEPRATK